ncbi:MAG: hypothetical protein J5794_08080, partial [Lachnospiraceae bacterium]|nr:hypothetical protein [Lachnospiraceae bacterium]
EKYGVRPIFQPLFLRSLPEFSPYFSQFSLMIDGPADASCSPVRVIRSIHVLPELFALRRFPRHLEFFCQAPVRSNAVIKDFSSRPVFVRCRKKSFFCVRTLTTL